MTQRAIALPKIVEKRCWFALRVKPRHEKAAAKNLRSKGLEEFLPLYHARRTWSDRLKLVELPLFPGYVFCRFDYADRHKALVTPSVTSIVSFGTMAAPIEDTEIMAIQAMLRSGLPVQPWPYLQIGQRIRIERGALCGLQGIVVRREDSWRVVVSVELLRRSVSVEIDRDMLVAAGGAAPVPSVSCTLPG